MKPEKIVQGRILFWGHRNGFWLHVIESKAQFSKAMGRYTKKLSGAPQGFSDLVGIAPGGTPCFIELKAPGKIGNLSLYQELFLFEAIKRGAFALVTDSENHIDDVWKRWKSLPAGYAFEKRQLLIDACKFDKIGANFLRGDNLHQG